MKNVYDQKYLIKRRKQNEPDKQYRLLFLLLLSLFFALLLKYNN